MNKYLYLLLIGLIWGSQYLLNDKILQYFTPLGLATFRIFFGLITLNIIALCQAMHTRPRPKVAKAPMTLKLFGFFMLLGAVEAAFPFYLIAFGQKHLNSSITSIIMGMIPLFTVVLALALKRRKKASVGEIVGLFIAFMGLIVLVNPSTESFQGSLLGYGAILTAACSFALSFILMERIPKAISAVDASRWVLSIYVLPFLIIWYLTNDQPIPTTLIPWSYTILLGALASGVIYILYINLTRLAGATFASLSNYLVPVVGTILGIAILNEAFTWNIAAALGLLLLGLAVMNQSSALH